MILGFGGEKQDINQEKITDYQLFKFCISLLSSIVRDKAVIQFELDKFSMHCSLIAQTVGKSKGKSFCSNHFFK